MTDRPTYTVIVPSRPDLSRTFINRDEAIEYHYDVLFVRRLDSQFVKLGGEGVNVRCRVTVTKRVTDV